MKISSISLFSNTLIRSFHNRHIGITKQDLPPMLKTCTVDSLSNLINEVVPKGIKKDLEYKVPISEHIALKNLKNIMYNNKNYTSLIGLGYNNNIMPYPIKRHVLENPKWYTAYTPYQAEISQGRLECQYNFQKMISSLTGLETANSSLLDESSAAVETMNMSYNIDKKNRNRFLCSINLHPQIISTLQTRSNISDIKLEIVDFNEINFDSLDNVFGIMFQYPNTYGTIDVPEELIAYSNKNSIITSCTSDILSLSMIKSPGDLGVDICFGTTQRFGIPLWFGGPHPAYLSCKKKFIRNMPGRIIGKSIDILDDQSYRLALQTREQHIKKDKATSNICTSQSLLANVAALYSIYHGPHGLREISNKTHDKAKMLDCGLAELGIDTMYSNYFDTLCLKFNNSPEIYENFKNHNIFLRQDKDLITLNLDETISDDKCIQILNIFSSISNKDTVFNNDFIDYYKTQSINKLDQEYVRKDNFLTDKTFNSYHTETEFMRYIYKLTKKDYTLCEGMIPLGSCTMKLNSVSELEPLSWESVMNHHPYIPLDNVSGYLKLFEELSDDLKNITGFDNISYQSNSGSMGEYSGLLCIRKYHENNGEDRNICLIPTSAHGTNFSSAKLAGYDIIKFPDDDYDKFLKIVKDNCNNLGCLMITYPNTNGIFQDNIKKICDTIHKYGGLVYMDGANMNAQVGITNPALAGADVCHLNLHKTFCIPHGGGGPGMGPILCNDKLKNFLPNNIFQTEYNSLSIGSITSSNWSSASLLTIPYLYIKMMGSDKLKYASEIAILNSNYLKDSLKDYYTITDVNSNNRVGHEFIIDVSEFKKYNITENDISKRLIDYNFHPGTMSWPRNGVIMFEPTESESKKELDRLIDALINIKKEIDEIKNGAYDQENNVLKNSPHSLKLISNWNYNYSIKKAYYPSKYLDHNKYYPSVNRVDNKLGDINLLRK